MSENLKSSPFYQNLNRGFQFLADSRKDLQYHHHHHHHHHHQQQQQQQQPWNNKDNTSKFHDPAVYFEWEIPPKIVVNVIDPVRKVSATSSTTAPLYFSRFNQYLQRKCNHRIPISSLPTLIKDNVTASSSSPSVSINSSSTTVPIQLVTNATPLTNQRSSSASASTPSSIIDVPEWYADPTCHVYLAPCSSLEHYKKSVKASISAFLNQIDSTSSTSANLLTTSASTNNLNARQAAETAKSVVQASGHYYWSRQCILVILPIKEGANSSNSSSSSPAKESNMSRSMSMNDMPKKVLQDKLTSTTSSTDMDNPSLSQQNSSTSHATNLLLTLSKEMKSLYKIVATDFPSARTCILSSLGSMALDKIVEGGGSNTHDNSSGDDHEWNTFLQALSDAVSAGFQDCIHRYEEDLTGMDLQLLSAAQSLKKNSKKQKQTHFHNSNKNHTFDDDVEEDEEYCSLMKRYFLVKEGLALSYLQIHHHSDALRLYQQMDEMALITGKWKPQWDDTELLSSPMRLVDIAQSGDSRLFRQVLSYQKRLDLIQLYYLAQQYFFSRQVQLLFFLDRPLEILERCIHFIQKFYTWKSLSSKAYKMGEAYVDDASQLVVEAWSVEICWSVFSAYNQFYAWTSSKSTSLSSRDHVDEEHSAAKGVSDLLHFTRKRLLVLSRILFSTSCAPYRANNVFETRMNQVQSISTNDESSIEKDNQYLLGPRQKCASRFSWVGKSFSSQTEFNSMYLRFYDSVVSMCHVLRYQRCAARLLMEKADIFASNGNIQEAALLILKAFDKNGCRFRGWEGLTSWSFSRLLKLQREAGGSPLYVSLLTSILSRRTHSRLPTTIAHELQKDLESFIGKKELCTESFSLSPFTIDLSPDHGQKQEHCVFDIVLLTVTIRSYLPKLISADALSFVTSYTSDAIDGLSIEDSSNSLQNEYIIDMTGPIVLEPGINKLTFEWVPIFPGFYKLLKSILFWREAIFIHENSTVIKCRSFARVRSYEPDQSLHVYPHFLYPRGVQKVNVNFDSGSSDVEQAILVVKCCDMVQIVTENDNFTESLCLTLGPLNPQRTINQSFTIRSDWQGGSYDSKKALDIQVFSKYRHAKYPLLPQNLRDFIPTPSSHTLSSSVDIVGSPSFTIDDAKSFRLANGCIAINIKLSCNSTRPIVLNHWSVEYQSQYHPVKEEDMNIGLFKRSLTHSDEIFLGFKCLRNASINERIRDDRPILHLSFSNEYSESFTEEYLVGINLEHSIILASQSTIDLNEVQVTLKSSVDNGVSGNPVRLTYTVVRNSFLSSLKKKNNLLKYAIRFNSDHWLVAGKIEGLIELTEEESYVIGCVGVPIKVGIIESYPCIHLTMIKEQSDPTILEVRINQPRLFQSLPRTEQSIVTVP